MSTRHAFLAQSHGSLALLEEVLVGLVAQGIAQIHAIDGCAYDVQAVMRGRAERFPRAVSRGAAGYADFVLASVLAGVVESPEEELRINDALRQALVLHTQPERIHIDGVPVAVGEAAASGSVLVVRGERTRRRLDLGRGIPRLDPGHLRGLQHDGEAATLAIVTRRADGLEVAFQGVDGEQVEPARTVPVPSR